MYIGVSTSLGFQWLLREDFLRFFFFLHSIAYCILRLCPRRCCKCVVQFSEAFLGHTPGYNIPFSDGEGGVISHWPAIA